MLFSNTNHDTVTSHLRNAHESKHLLKLDLSTLIQTMQTCVLGYKKLE